MPHKLKIRVKFHYIKLSSSTDFKIKKYFNFILPIPKTGAVQKSLGISSSSLISLVWLNESFSGNFIMGRLSLNVVGIPLNVVIMLNFFTVGALSHKDTCSNNLSGIWIETDDLSVWKWRFQSIYLLFHWIKSLEAFKNWCWYKIKFIWYSTGLILDKSITIVSKLTWFI